MRPPRQPYALDTPVFAFAAIAAFAGRAPIGGTREVAIAAYVTARMADDVAGNSLPAEARKLRSASARRWLSTLTIAETVRQAFLELITATESDASATAPAVRRVIEVTTGSLDGASRSELERLARDLDAQTVVGT